MVELPVAWISLLNALLGAPVAWQAPSELAAALGLDDESVTDTLCDLDTAGWLVVWESDKGPYVTLSSLAAERLCVHLIEVGPAETPRWAPVADPGPPPARSKNVCQSSRSASFELEPDPDSPPDIAAERAERASDRLKAQASQAVHGNRGDDLPRPSAYVGLGLSPWPGPAQVSDGVCPACCGRRLRPHEYCLFCDRWGLDGLLPAPLSGRSPHAARSPKWSRPRQNAEALEREALERDRTRRKDKRRRRRQSQSASRRNKSRTTPTKYHKPDPRPPTNPPQ
jgi:hypothetical protein